VDTARSTIGVVASSSTPAAGTPATLTDQFIMVRKEHERRGMAQSRQNFVGRRCAKLFWAFGEYRCMVFLLLSCELGAAVAVTMEPAGNQDQEWWLHLLRDGKRGCSMESRQFFREFVC